MRITYQPWGETLAELVDAGRRAEQAGADVLWVSELHRSATITAAALAHGTETARIGTSIALAFTRSPMTTALEALDLDEIADGRFILGLGTGVQRLNEDWHNARWGKPVGHIRETVRNVRHFVANATSGAEMSLDGEFEPMRIRGYERPFAVRRTEIPIYLAAMGPAMTRLAGRIADGWISHELCSPRYLADRVLPELESGLTAAERSRSEIDAVVSACCSVDNDPAEARRRIAGLVGFYASVRTYADFFAFHDLAEEQQAVIEAFRSGRGADYLADAVSDRMIEALTMTGDRDQVAAQILGYQGLADAVKLSPPTHGISAADTRQAQDQIIAMIAEVKENVA
ncbi:LLM class flavin-dependent oxidoreductase [Nocardioides sp. Bht2]|uniref:LLM class flavin-dependent oxidoreductase n=1 Tax=Nocardioides sp. Bht2 TaxID=3392297 RepID=UPI0039B3B66A